MKSATITVNESNAFVTTFDLSPTGSGPLDGLCFAVKDVIDVAGCKTGCGNPTWRDSHPTAVAHAVCVEQLLRAGARCVGKAICDELAFSLLGENYFYGTPLNARAPDRVPGGSSSGSASAVACGLVDFAQMRDADLTLDCASQVSDKNPSVAPPLKVSDCSQITDGAASVVLVSEKYLDKIGRDRSKTTRLLGYGHSTDYLPLDKKDAPTFSIARKAAEKAFRMANLTPRNLQGAEVHDCFSITEIVAYEILGLAESGKGVELVKSGATALPQVRSEKFKGPFQIPVNAGGGLIADGHPVGATGVRQVFEAYQQLTEQAGAHQIENAKKFLTFNMGGSLTTSVAMVWGRE